MITLKTLKKVLWYVKGHRLGHIYLNELVCFQLTLCGNSILATFSAVILDDPIMVPILTLYLNVFLFLFFLQATIMCTPCLRMLPLLSFIDFCSVG